MRPRRFSGVMVAAAIAWLAATLSPLAQRESGAASKASLAFRDGSHARIPFELRFQHVLVRGRLNGADSAWIAVDTGASSSVMDQGLAQHLGLKTVGEHTAMGAGGTQRATTVEDVTIELEGLALHRQTMDAIDMTALSRVGGRPLQVVIGYELFQSCVVRFDYPAGVMDVWDAKHAPRHLEGVTVPMTLENNHPYVGGTLMVPGRPPLEGRFVIDTGSSAGLILAPEVVARESLPAAFPRLLVAIGRGVGGDVWNRVGRATAFTIGDLTFTKPIVVMPDSGAGHIAAGGSIGNIGGQILGRCRVTFDYPRHTIGFEPGPDFDRPFEADMSGATLQRTTEGMKVIGVNPETPAAEAGLEVGDVVRKIDGEAAESVDPAALRLRFQQDGRTVRFRVGRGLDSLDVTLKLRRLL